MVRYSRVDMYSTIVLKGVLVVIHMSWLGILAQSGGVISRTRRFQRPQRSSVVWWIRHQQPFSDQPVSVGGGLIVLILLHESAERIRDVFIQCSRLTHV